MFPGLGEKDPNRKVGKLTNPSQRSQTLAQITTQLNDGASRTDSKWTVQGLLHHMVFGSYQPTRVPWLNACTWVKPRLKSYGTSLGCFETRCERPSHTAPTNLTELWTALANIWEVFPVEPFQKLVESMPCLVAAVIKARGGPLQGRYP
ncbi:hypothetical protein TNCV_3381491 [Trichonephila clavipes]|nr:hypothetical protein TNCV_3381491 [Trichonephila clavipes]